jgi:drug/metabolite transporter (DMT)-like permease
MSDFDTTKPTRGAKLVAAVFSFLLVCLFGVGSFFSFKAYLDGRVSIAPSMILLIFVIGFLFILFRALFSESRELRPNELMGLGGVFIIFGALLFFAGISIYSENKMDFYRFFLLSVGSVGLGVSAISAGRRKVNEKAVKDYGRPAQ